MFKTQYAKQLLEAHKPNQRAYLCSEIEIEANAENLAIIDDSYAELVSLGLVEKMSGQVVNVGRGCDPKPLFRLTGKGVQAKKNLGP